jgi:hypothetical protein
MTVNKDNSTPEKRIQYLLWKGFKSLFLMIMAIIAYIQLYEYVSEKPEINISLNESIKNGNEYKTLISIENGSQSISFADIVRPINLDFNDTIKKITHLKSKIKPVYEIQNQLSLSINFDLINKNEKFNFIVYSKGRLEINGVDFRIKNIDNIQIYDFEKKPKPIYRILNIWVILFLVSFLLFIDALLVIAKDKELESLKSFIFDFPLNDKNKKEFIKGYENIYKKYKVRIKPSPKIMKQVIKNLFICFPLMTNEDKNFIKSMTNLKTELYTFYRARTAFLIISPITILISALAITLNYFYYEIAILNNNMSLDGINKVILTILLTLSIMIILFPRRTMNFLFIKKSAKVKF